VAPAGALGLQVTLIEALHTPAGQAHQMMVVAVFLAKLVASPVIPEDHPLRHAFSDERFERPVHGDEAHPRMDPSRPCVNRFHILGTAQPGQRLQHSAPLRRYAPAPGPQLIKHVVYPPRHRRSS